MKSDFESSWQTPRMHSIHKKKCGCAIEGDTEVFICKACGAGYRQADMVGHNLWTCYDCGEVYVVNPYFMELLPFDFRRRILKDALQLRSELRKRR